ncbi:MAG: acyltransferase family protein [Actinomycetota bacterium]|nr:acyltransferase family protein [Actinomycetota bacterium]
MTPQALPSSSARENRREDIQGLRALAVGFVVAFHAGLPVPGGFLGVDVFFVISGFVITAMLAREWVRTQNLKFSTFYARRFRRLTPALALLVGVVVIISALIQSPMGDQQIAAKTGIGALLLTANVVIAKVTGGYFDAPAASNPLLNTWSLSVEEQFYLIFPLLLFIGWKLAKRANARWIPAALVGAVAFGSIAIAMLEAQGHQIPFMPTWLGGFYGPASRAWEFAVGALLALAASRIELRISRILGFVLGVIGLIGLVASLALVTDQTVWPGPLTILPVVSTLLLLACGMNEGNVVSRFLGRSPFVAVGNISYSWYLWHWPCIVFALMLWPTTPGIAFVAAMASLLPAIASYNWLEQPIRLLRDVSKPRMARLVAFTLVPPIVLALGLLSAANNGFWTPRVQNFIAAVSPMHAGNAAGCNKSIAPSDRRPTACMWNAAATGTPVYLIGDSHADHLSEGLIGATQATGRPLTIATANACPFIDVHFHSNAAPRSKCRQFVQKTLQWLESQPPGDVVLSGSSVYWNSKVFSAGPTADSMTNEREAKDANLVAGLISTITRIQKAGHRVILAQDVPFFARPYASDPHQFSAIEIARNVDLGTTMTRAFADENQKSARVGIAAAAKATGAIVLDPRSYFCPQDQCTTQFGDLYLYRDDGHISVGASTQLAPLISSILGSN